jgi:threonine/homoserine/homoserine lactone efflux protein
MNIDAFLAFTAGMLILTAAPGWSYEELLKNSIRKGTYISLR